MMHGVFDDFDFDGLWDDCDYSLKSYVEPPLTDALCTSIEEELGGFRLPAAYVKLAQRHNGGMLEKSCYPVDEPSGWAEDHIAVTGLYAIGRIAHYSLCGKLGSKFWEGEWEYPAIGIYFADTPTAGHQMLALDYRECGKQGEPQVVYVDQEDDYRITVIAPDFATFIKGLVSEEEFDTSAEDYEAAVVTVERGTFSPIVQRALDATRSRFPDGAQALRRLARQIVDEKGHFSLHADERSHLMYEAMFWLCSQLRTVTSFEDFVHRPQGQTSYDHPNYELMIVFGLVAQPYGFSTGGYAQGFVSAWWYARVKAGAITETPEGYRLTPEAEAALLQRLLLVARPA